MGQGPAVRAGPIGVQSAMSATSTTRKPRALDRLLIVAAVAAVLVSVGAWFAMNRPGAVAEAAGAGSSVSANGVGTADRTTDAATDADARAGATAPESPAAAPVDAPAGESTGAAGGTAPAAATPSAASAPLSPTTAFLTALTASGLAPPIDDAQKLAMADDVCQELGYGSTYADVVRALTFAGASDAEAANFAGLAITHLCSQYEIG
jgi:hypothetical protein